ncbi:MAG: hypothetical protein ABI533_07365 [Betaproteobacteria bacterium]
MMHCRMCSQRLTRLGRLCRECERELDAARAGADSVGAFAPGGDAVATRGHRLAWPPQLSSRIVLATGAFAVGLAAAAGVYAVSGMRPSAARDSVMIDRDVTNVSARNFHVRVDAPAAIIPTSKVADGAPVAVLRTSQSVQRSRSRERAAVPVSSDRVAVASATPPAAAGVAAPAGYDRVLGLATALDVCASESFFARLACQQRARSRYCDGMSGQIPQCAEPPPRDYGQ